jgi:predicted transcriptional regulator
MSGKVELSRITVDIPKTDHKKLKTIAALQGRSMRLVIIRSIEEYLSRAKMPNKETLKVMKDIENGEGLVQAADAADLFKKLGI